MRKLIASVGVLLLTWSIGSLAADTPPMKFDLAKMTMVVEVEEGITGEDVFIDPCHPNPLGHRRLAVWGSCVMNATGSACALYITTAIGLPSLQENKSMSDAFGMKSGASFIGMITACV